MDVSKKLWLQKRRDHLRRSNNTVLSLLLFRSTCLLIERWHMAIWLARAPIRAAILEWDMQEFSHYIFLPLCWVLSEGYLRFWLKCGAEFSLLWHLQETFTATYVWFFHCSPCRILTAAQKPTKNLHVQYIMLSLFIYYIIYKYLGIMNNYWYLQKHHKLKKKIIQCLTTKITAWEFGIPMFWQKLLEVRNWFEEISSPLPPTLILRRQ